MPANHNVPHTPEARAKMRKAHLGKPCPWSRRDTRVESGVTLYICGACKQFKPREGFYTNKRTLLGLTSQCRKCHTQTGLASRDREKALVSNRRSEAKRRARKAQSAVTITVKELAEFEKVWGDRCLKCGATADLQWDHIEPLAKGGAHSLANLQRLCGRCNNQKHTRTKDYRTPTQKVWVPEFKVIEGAA